MSDEQEILESVQNAKSPGSFNIIDVLQGRGYPESVVDIYMDESSIYQLSIINEKLEELDKSIGKKQETERQKSEREELFEQKEYLNNKLMESKLSVYLMGISEGRREELYRQALKKYPMEYEVQNNISSLISGDSQKIEKDSPDRDALFTDYLWQANIKKIVNVSGEEQSEFSYSTIKTMRETFPLNAMIKINEGIEKLRASTALFTIETGEDFLAKP